MILTRLDALTVYRMHTPKWAFAPTSGAGAAQHGGGANRPDVAALSVVRTADPTGAGP
jgi:RES domain-containing protein